MGLPADHRVTIKENGKRDKYFILARELKKINLWYVKVTVTSVVVGTLEMVLKGLIKSLEELEIVGQTDRI